MVVLDEKLITRAWEGKLGIVIHDQLEQVRVQVEKQFHDNSLSDEIINDLRQIQCIICDAEEIAENKDLDLLTRINQVLDKIELANAEIKSYHKKHQKPLPDQILEDINKLLYLSIRKLKTVRSQLESIYSNLTAIAQLGTKLTKDGNEDTYKNWAEAVESTAEALEVILENYVDIPLGMVEDFAIELLSVTSTISYDSIQKETYRRRIKYSATFMLNLVGKYRLENLSQKSAEAKAVERIKNIDETEWIVVSEAGKKININKINERAAYRGYNIQLPCEDSPTG